jgi:hypothetical protein
MKNIYSILTGLLLTACVFSTQQATAQAPQKMSYQLVLRNSSNVLLASTAVGVKISVLQVSVTGPAVYVETQTATTNANGLVSIQIGIGTASTGSFAGINWANGPYFIKTETDPAGGSNYSITSTQEILSVPYALYAAKSGDTTTMGAISGSSAANAGTITSGVLRLTPADETNGGIVTTGPQTFAGNKTLTGTLGVGTAISAAFAQLDISSTTKGLLPPKMTAAQRNAIATSSVAAGLTIWCSNCHPSGQMQVFNGTVWTDILGRAAQQPLAIGDSYNGGKIAYILVPGDPGYDANIPHGLIAATSDQSTGIRWYNGSYSITLASGRGLGTGVPNTRTIIASQGANATSYAAGLARAYRGGGYTDWYLPSKDELDKLYSNKVAIGGFTNNYYWSSSENDFIEAWCQNFGNGDQLDYNKLDPYYVRAVRPF